MNSNTKNRIMYVLDRAAQRIENQNREIEQLRKTAEAYRTLSIAIHLGDPRRNQPVGWGAAEVDTVWEIRNLMSEMQPEIDAENQKEKAYYAEQDAQKRAAFGATEDFGEEREAIRRATQPGIHVRSFGSVEELQAFIAELAEDHAAEFDTHDAAQKSEDFSGFVDTGEPTIAEKLDRLGIGGGLASADLSGRAQARKADFTGDVDRMSPGLAPTPTPGDPAPFE